MTQWHNKFSIWAEIRKKSTEYTAYLESEESSDQLQKDFQAHKHVPHKQLTITNIILI